jgi:hypothetical protein
LPWSRHRLSSVEHPGHPRSPRRRSRPWPRGHSATVIAGPPRGSSRWREALRENAASLNPRGIATARGGRLGRSGHFRTRRRALGPRHNRRAGRAGGRCAWVRLQCQRPSLCYRRGMASNHRRCGPLPRCMGRGRADDATDARRIVQHAARRMTERARLTGSSAKRAAVAPQPQTSASCPTAVWFGSRSATIA